MSDRKIYLIGAAIFHAVAACFFVAVVWDLAQDIMADPSLGKLLAAAFVAACGVLMVKWGAETYQ